MKTTKEDDAYKGLNLSLSNDSSIMHSPLDFFPGGLFSRMYSFLRICNLSAVFGYDFFFQNLSCHLEESKVCRSCLIHISILSGP